MNHINPIAATPRRSYGERKREGGQPLSFFVMLLWRMLCVMSFEHSDHDDDFPELPLKQDVNVLALVKGGERYIFLYDDENRAEALRTLGRFASNPELSFTWYDAAVLSQKIRQVFQEENKAVKNGEFKITPRFSLPTEDI